MLGEGTHGTAEFYRLRHSITQRLIQEKGFRLIAVEGDWPDAYQVNDFVRGRSEGTARDALAAFQRFPTWMWGNQDVLDFITWLRQYNDGLRDPARKVGFYGLDLYSLFASMEAVISYLERVDPESAEIARRQFACFEPYGPNMQAYAMLAGYHGLASCEKEVLAVLEDIRRRREQYLAKAPEIEHFYAEQSARLAAAAERYYRAMLRGDPDSWNVRDEYMFETLQRLLAHAGPDAKVVVWAHNTHVGDYRATGMHAEGYLNIGQLARERYGRQMVAVGFGTHRGTVTAADEWGGEPERKRVPPALADSYEDVFHRLGIPQFLLLLRDLPDQPMANLLRGPRRERAIGVVYNPALERFGNWFEARLPDQFDAYIFVDQTHAVQPLFRVELPAAA
jgi:erythromycin esterase-like protein